MPTSSPLDNINAQFSSLVFTLMNDDVLYGRCIALTPSRIDGPWRAFFQDKLRKLMVRIEEYLDEVALADYWCTMMQYYHMLNEKERHIGSILLSTLFPWLQVKINQRYMNEAEVNTDDGIVFVAKAFT